MRRMGKRIYQLAVILVATAALAACGSSSSTSAKAPSTSSAAPTTAAAAAPTTTTACAHQVKSWLAQEDDNGFTSGHTVQDDIIAILFSAKSYIKFDPGNTGAGQNFLMFMGDTNYQGISSADQDPPSCADPSGFWEDFITDAGSASNDTAGTSQAQSDVQATLRDFSNLNAELYLLARGVQIKSGQNP